MTDHNAHAVYAPSSAHRWIPCPASAPGIAALHRVHPDESGEEAIEGTAAHDEIERCLGELNGMHVGQGEFEMGAFPVNARHPAAHGIALVLDYVRQLVTGTPGRLWIEQRVRLTDKIWGRCDVCHWHAESGVLTIVDYKNGYVDVDAVENEQLRIYAAGSIYTHNLPAKWIRYVVVQPNSFMPVPRVKQWPESAESLFAFAASTAAIPDGPQTFAASVGEHCRDCPLFGACPTSKDVLLQLQTMIARPAVEVPPEQVALFMACEKPIDHYFKALWKHGTAQALKGNVPPGMKVVTSTKHRQWKDVNAARKFVLERKGVDALDPPTPAQAEEKLGLDITGLADRPPGGPALAFESDKRPEYKPKSAAEMFAGVVGGGK